MFCLCHPVLSYFVLISFLFIKNYKRIYCVCCLIFPEMKMILDIMLSYWDTLCLQRWLCLGFHQQVLLHLSVWLWQIWKILVRRFSFAPVQTGMYFFYLIFLPLHIKCEGYCDHFCLSVCLSLCVCVCVCVTLSVNTIKGEPSIRFWWNLVRLCQIIIGRSSSKMGFVR